MASKHRTNIVWPSQEAIEEAKEKQRQYKKRTLSEFVRFAIERVPRKK